VRRLPKRDAVGQLRELGFTTVVVHQEGTRPIMRFEWAAHGENPELGRLHSHGRLRAYTLEAVEDVRQQLRAPGDADEASSPDDD